MSASATQGGHQNRYRHSLGSRNVHGFTKFQNVILVFNVLSVFNICGTPYFGLGLEHLSSFNISANNGPPNFM